MNSVIDFLYISLFGAALLLSVVGLFISAAIHNMERWNKRFFVSYFIVLMLCCIFFLVEFIFNYYPASIQALLCTLFLESLLLSVPLPMLTFFLLHCCKESIRESKLLRAVLSIWGVYLVILVCDLFTDGFSTITPDMNYSRGPLYPLQLVPVIVILLLNLAGVIKRRAQLSRKAFLILLVAMVPETVTLCIQVFIDIFPLIDISIVVSALAMYGFVLLDQIERNLHQQREIARQQREIAHERASVMVLQMRPHFIYNTLMSIYSLCNLDPQKARQVTLDFTNYLRKNFNAVASDSTIPFTAELEHTRAYLAVEQAQYEDMLAVDYDTPLLHFRLPQLDEHEYYTLVYEYALTGLTDEDAGVSAYNTLEATSTDNHDTTTDYADYFIYNQQRKKLAKDGIPYEEYVQWHISVNARESDIAGKVVYDDSFADAQNETINGTNGIVVQKGWADAVLGVDYEYVYDGSGAIIGIRFLPADGSTPNTNTYHITYYTYPDAAYGETTSVHNDAEFDGDSVSYDVVVHGGDFDKTSDGDESLGNDLHGMNWTVRVEIPVGGILSGTSFSDTLSPEGHYMTQAQYNALVAALGTAWGTNVSVTPIYTDNYITGYTFTVGTAGNGYLMDNGDVDVITWQYQTTGDMSGKISESFVNTFSDGEKTLPISNVISPNVKKLNARKISDWSTIFTEEPTTISLDYDDEDKTFVWIAQVTPVPGLQEYRVTDTLPEGVELLGVKVISSPLTAWNYSMENTNNNLTIAADGTISGEVGNLWATRTIASGEVSTTADGRQLVDITLEPANPANGSSLFNDTFNVIYYCQLAEDAWPQNGTVHLALNNTVSVEADGQDYGQAENQINIDATKTEDIVNKVGSWDKDSHLITYSIDINPLAENLLTSAGGTIDPDWLTFTDVLSYTARQGTGTGEVVLSLNSVVLEKEENGVWTPLSNIQWTAHTENDSVDPNIKNAIIEMSVPDETHLRLTYIYHVNCSMDSGITLANSATLEGHGEESDHDDTHIEVEDFPTSGESTFEEFCLIKIDQEDGRPLSGAVFTVYFWDAQSNAWVSTGKTYTTDNIGRIIIKVTDEYDNGTRIYAKDAAYCIMETAAPVGYILPENPQPFYFWFSENELAPPNAPDGFMLTAADISTSSHRIEAENQCDYVNTGVFGVRLLPSFVALLVAGVGTSFIALRIVKKKRYGIEV